MSTTEWKKKNTSQYPIRFTNSSGIPAAIRMAAEDTGIADSTYIRQAIIEKLIRDGYLKAGEPK